MKVGDLIKHKRLGGLALIVNIKESGPINGTPEGGLPGVYKFPVFMWLDTNEIDSCADTFMEVINESR